MKDKCLSRICQKLFTLLNVNEKRTIVRVAYLSTAKLMTFPNDSCGPNLNMSFTKTDVNQLMYVTL